MLTIRRPRLFAVVILALIAVASGARALPRVTVPIQILAVSDWHGQLDPLNGVGGAAALSSFFAADRAVNPNTLTLTAGDSFNASPPLASFFDEEPAVKAMNIMGFTADTLGNHNFDRGLAHLRQMIALAEFPFVAANLTSVASELPAVQPYVIVERAGVKIGIVGVVNPDASELVAPGRMGSVTVTDPVPAANRARAAAQAAGAQLVIAITHLGVTGVHPETGQAFGPLVEFADAVGGFDLILGDHTDIAYAGTHGRAHVVENRSKGLTYARITLDVDPTNGRVHGTSVRFVTPTASLVTPDPQIQEMLAPYRAQLSARRDAGIGTGTAVFPQGGNIERLGEVALGNLVTDAMRLRYGTQLAFTSGGGLRAPLPSSYLPADRSLRRPAPGYAAGPPYDLVVGDPHTILPFGNAVVTRQVTGAQVWAALENGVRFMPAASGRFPQISGFRFSYDATQPVGARVVGVWLSDGTPIAPDGTSYSFATSDFINAGGDGYTMFADGSGTTRDLMADVLLEHIRTNSPVSPYVDGRIARIA